MKKIIALMITLMVLTGCRTIQKDVDTTVTVEDRNTNKSTTTHTVDKSKESSFTIGLSDGPGKTIWGGDMIKIQPSVVGGN